jgi:hypothetical protein
MGKFKGRWGVERPLILGLDRLGNSVVDYWKVRGKQPIKKGRTKEWPGPLHKIQREHGQVLFPLFVHPEIGVVTAVKELSRASVVELAQ